jgi:hypothetical protein
MCSEKDGNNPNPPKSSFPFSPGKAPDPDEVPPNAIDAAFLKRLEEQEEPPTASQAELAGPWRVEPLPEEAGGGFGIFHEGASFSWRFQPFARFESRSTAQLAAALLPGLGRDASYRFKPEREPQGWAIQSRAEWGEVIAHVEVFTPALIDALHVVDGLMRSPRALADFLEVCGKVALEKAGAILAERFAEE